MLGERVSVAAAGIAPQEPVLEAAMLGHCPGKAVFSALAPASRQAMREAGFVVETEFLEQCLGKAREKPHAFHDFDLPENEMQRIAGLHHLPIPVHSHAEFQQIFPQADRQATLYRSLVAGDSAWLPGAVRDFFSSGGQRLWVVSIPQEEGAEGFLPQVGDGLHRTLTLRGLASVLPVEGLGLVALPDLERQRLPHNLVSLRGKRLQNPDPVFLPCSTDQEDDHKERRAPGKKPAKPIAFAVVLDRISRALERYRPDIQCLLSLGLDYSATVGSTVAAPADLAALETHKQGARADRLRRIQLLFPYLSGPGYRLKSATGYVAGTQCRVAQTEGPWRSIAGRSLALDGVPFPALQQLQVSQLREGPGISVLKQGRRAVTLDDERLAVPALPLQHDSGSSQLHRSAEITRFIGYLARELRRLGMSLVFTAAADSSEPRILLEQFFNRLYQAGALRGKRPEDAYSISRRDLADHVIGYDIVIAPAFPLDAIRLTLLRSRDAWEVNWRV